MGHLYTDKYVSILLRGYRMHLYYKIHERVKRRILLSTYLFFLLSLIICLKGTQHTWLQGRNVCFFSHYFLYVGKYVIYNENLQIKLSKHNC